MDPEDLIIRPARTDEADVLSHMLLRSRAYWDYPMELMERLIESGELTITPEEIESGMTYVAEDEEQSEALGFYSMEVSGALCLIRDICVLPEYIGTELLAALFLHACEIAESAGAESVRITASPHEVSFFEEMGAELVCNETASGGAAPSILSLNL